MLLCLVRNISMPGKGCCYACPSLKTSYVTFLKQKWVPGTIKSLLLYFSGSVTVICAKGVSSMINLTFSGMNQLSHPLPYIMFILMVITSVAQVRYVMYVSRHLFSLFLVFTISHFLLLFYKTLVIFTVSRMQSVWWLNGYFFFCFYVVDF